MKKIYLSLILSLWISNFVFGALPKTLYVVNGLAETLSKINLEHIDNQDV